MLKLELQYFGHIMWRADSLEKILMQGGIEGRTKDEMAGMHHRLDRHEFEWTPGVGDGQGGLACCDSWGCKELDVTEQLNWTELFWKITTLSGKITPIYPLTFLGTSSLKSRCWQDCFSWGSRRESVFWPLPVYGGWPHSLVYGSITSSPNFGLPTFPWESLGLQGDPASQS